MTLAAVLILGVLLVAAVAWGLCDMADVDPFANVIIAWVAAISVVIILVTWAIYAHGVSRYGTTNCQKRAEGYGLTDSEWSVRQGCRVYLPSGQLVPEDRIRITTDGQIVVVDE